MNKVTIKYKEQNYNLRLDFNRSIDQIFEKIDIRVDDEARVRSLLSKKILNRELSLNENGIVSNEILEIKEIDEDKL